MRVTFSKTAGVLGRWVVWSSGEVMHPSASRAFVTIRRPGRRNRWRSYLHAPDGAELLKVAELTASEPDSEAQIGKAGKLMDAALTARIAKRAPLTGVRDVDGRVTITDGKSTLEQLRRRGVLEVPVKIVFDASAITYYNTEGLLARRCHDWGSPEMLHSDGVWRSYALDVWHSPWTHVIRRSEAETMLPEGAPASLLYAKGESRLKREAEQAQATS